VSNPFSAVFITVVCTCMFIILLETNKRNVPNADGSCYIYIYLYIYARPFTRLLTVSSRAIPMRLRSYEPKGTFRRIEIRRTGRIPNMPMRVRAGPMRYH